MATNRAGMPPTLSSWAEVDPARYPFDPSRVTASIPTVPAGIGPSDLEEWRDAVSVELSERYGPWAYYWHRSPTGRGPYDWITRFPAPADVPAAAADSLRAWRRWLERVAEPFDEFLPLLEQSEAAGPADLAATWESAVLALERAVLASVVDADYWAGWCRQVLHWFLTAAGVPTDRAWTLIGGTVDRSFDGWISPTAADLTDVAERLTRSVLGLPGKARDAAAGEWPDTWPRNWPAWRATNTTGGPSS